MATGRQLLEKVALVTGGGSGIGRAVCQVFARHGASVVAADINVEGAKATVDSLPTDTECRHHAFALDVADRTAVQSLVKDLTEMYQQPLSLLVNSAGITRDRLMLKMDEKRFDEVIAVNLKGTFLVTQAVSQAMIQHRVKSGSIINISSIIGKYGNIGQCNYGASKAGVVGFTKTTAKELARYGIRCNAILPGFIRTPMTEAVPEAILNQINEIIPLQRQGKPTEIADACLFLASDQSSYITGAELEVSGCLALGTRLSANRLVQPRTTAVTTATAWAGCVIIRHSGLVSFLIATDGQLGKHHYHSDNIAISINPKRH